MNEWYDSQKKPNSGFRELLQVTVWVYGAAVE